MRWNLMDPDIEKKFIAWMVGKRGKQPSTARTYLNAMRLFQKKYPDPDQVKQENIVQYLADLKLISNKNANTRRNRKVAIETFFGWYSQFAGIQNPAIDLGIIKSYHRIPKLVHPDEIERMCYYEHKKGTELSMRNSAVIAFFFMTGIRIGEFEKIKLGSIDRKTDHFTVLVPAQKGTFDRLVQFGKFIPGSLVDYFSRYYLLIKTQKMQKKSNPLFFKLNFRKLHEENLTAPMLRNSVNYMLKQAAYNAGIDRLITVHQLRHAYATYSYIDGLDIKILQNNLGHARLETTQQYIHIAGLITDDTLKHSPAAKVKSSPELGGYTELLKNV
jgi:site-specific recombinase XerD